MRVLIGLLISVFGAVTQASAPGEADEILAQLSKIRLDKKQIYNIRDITIRRDALSIYFNRGTIAFLEPVFGKVTGAIFIGNGEVVAIPPDSIEKQQVYKFTDSPVLHEPFRAAIFRFTDNTYEEILKEHSEHAEEEVSEDESAQFLPFEQTLNDRKGVLNYRILADYLEPSGRELFFSELNGEKHDWFNVFFDPRLVEEVVALKVHDLGNSAVTDLWTSFNRRGETRDLEAASRENKAPVDTLSYDIDAAISTDTRLDAKTVMRVKALIDGQRVLSFDLSRFLRVSAVSIDSGEKVSFYQPENAFVIVLPRPLRAGEEATLRFEYAGDVIQKRSAGAFYVGERGHWYPNLGAQDRASFNLTFHYPVAYTLVATGNRLKEWDENGLRHSMWKSDGEFPTAGFSLGDFTILADESAPTPIYVCVNNNVETKGPAENVLKEVRVALTYFSDLFGPYPYQRFTVLQFPVNYAQGWPALLYLSTSSTELARANEIAHQWFGNKVGWRTYHDQWISEGFANYAAAMYVENEYKDSPRMRGILEDARTRLLTRAPFGNSNESIGPIWLGYRLSTSSTPDGYLQTLHTKSTWVVHMLRMLMRGDGPSSDDAFLKMVRELLEASRGSVVSTWDFKRIAEKYMTKPMDLRGDKKLDWFFDQWVFGTGVPAYKLEYNVEDANDGFVVSGTVTQSEVPEGFIMPVPIYADDELLGRVIVDGDGGSFLFVIKKKPQKILLDPQFTVLWKP